MDKTSSPQVILRRKQVTARTGLARSTIYDHMQKGEFPRPIRLGVKIVGWLEAEVEEWLREKIGTSRTNMKHEIK